MNVQHTCAVPNIVVTGFDHTRVPVTSQVQYAKEKDMAYKLAQNFKVQYLICDKECFTHRKLRYNSLYGSCAVHVS
jgi:hypothetical protein